MPDYLVQYGTSAFVGRFTAAIEPPRGVSVLLRTPRGSELGTVLCEARANAAFDASGELLREATPADVEAGASAERMGTAILAAASLSDQPVTFLDCEVTLDRRGAVLHALPYGPCQLDALLAELSAQFDMAVRVHDYSQMKSPVDPPEPKTTCEKPGCGTAEGGCSSCSTGACGTGSACSKGKVQSASELTAYFAELREKFESSIPARTPLN